MIHPRSSCQEKVQQARNTYLMTLRPFPWPWALNMWDSESELHSVMVQIQTIILNSKLSKVPLWGSQGPARIHDAHVAWPSTFLGFSLPDGSLHFGSGAYGPFPKETTSCEGSRVGARDLRGILHGLFRVLVQIWPSQLTPSLISPFKIPIHLPTQHSLSLCWFILSTTHIITQNITYISFAYCL